MGRREPEVPRDFLISVNSVNMYLSSGSLLRGSKTLLRGSKTCYKCAAPKTVIRIKEKTVRNMIRTALSQGLIVSCGTRLCNWAAIVIRIRCEAVSDARKATIPLYPMIIPSSNPAPPHKDMTRIGFHLNRRRMKKAAPNRQSPTHCTEASATA